jgi:hypothetical protein
MRKTAFNKACRDYKKLKKSESKPNQRRQSKYSKPVSPKEKQNGS